MCFALSFRAIAALGAALLWLDVAPASAQSANLIANPALARGLPPPGWLAAHREEWLREHPVYRATCEGADVTREIRFLNRLVAYDEYLLSLPNTPDPDNPASAQLAAVARQSMTGLRRDVIVADALVAQLQLLPRCEAARPATPVAATAISVRPERAGDKPAPPASEPKSAGTPQPAEAGNTPPPGSDRLASALTTAWRR